MGAHPKAPSRLRNSGLSLDAAIAQNPQATLGTESGLAELPFLKKILAAAQPLSIQTHPDAARARAGFQAENEARIALDSPTRTYRDPNHKPELICALTPFDARCGFRPVAQTIQVVDRLAAAHAGVAPFRDRLAQSGPDSQVLADVLQWLLGGTDPAVQQVTAAVVAAAAGIDSGPWTTEIAWTVRFAELYPGDPGIVVALLLNHFTLAPGQALFLQAGILHAYLQGSGVEVMANSDNVIRGGLTPKHVDTAELAAVVDTTPAAAPVQTPAGAVHTFESPVPEFSMTRVQVDDGYQATVAGPEILIVTQGRFVIECGSTILPVRAGQPVWIAASDESWTAEGSGTLFRTTHGTR